MEMLTRWESVRDLIRHALENDVDWEEKGGKFVPKVLLCWFPEGHSEVIDIGQLAAQEALNEIMGRGGQPIGFIGMRDDTDWAGFDWMRLHIYQELPNDDEAWELTENFLMWTCSGMALGAKYGKPAVSAVA
jgi:hypothetical protein